MRRRRREACRRAVCLEPELTTRVVGTRADENPDEKPGRIGPTSPPTPPYPPLPFLSETSFRCDSQRLRNVKAPWGGSMSRLVGIRAWGYYCVLERGGRGRHVTDKTQRRGVHPEEPKTRDDTPGARARARAYVPPSPVVPEEPDTPELRAERHEVEILKLWGFGAELRDRIVKLEERREGSDRPTRLRIALKNWRPPGSLAVVVLLALLMLAAILAGIALASLFRR